MSGISGPAVYSCPWCGRHVEQGESCWCKQSQEEAMTRQEIRAALKGARADNVRLTAERDRLREAVSAFAQVCHNGGGEDCPECSLVMVCPRVHQDFKTARAALKHSSSAHGHFFDADDHIPCPEAKRCQLAMNPRPGEFCSGTTHSDGLCFVTNQKPDASTILAKPAGGES